jgi:methylmalonyl-CoA/ethylmalonyl-CoA epimerase
MIKGIGHIGIGVEDIQAYLEALHTSFGIPMPLIKEFPERKMRMALVQMGPVSLEVIQDDDENGLLGSFVKKHGNGIHHYCLITDDINADIVLLKGRVVLAEASSALRERDELASHLGV